MKRLLVLVATGLMVALSGCGDDDATASGASTSTTEAVTTTEAPDPSSTTEPDTTTASTVSSTAPPPAPPVACGSEVVITLTEYGLYANDESPETTVGLGEDADGAVADLTCWLGAPSTDTGWGAEEFCFSDQRRRLTWGDLEVVLIDNGGVRTVGQWFTRAEASAAGLRTPSGVGVLSPLADVQAAYPGGELFDVLEGDPHGLYRAEGGGSGEVIDFLTATKDPSGQVESMWGGEACARIVT